jgi:hypothetical protein
MKCTLYAFACRSLFEKDKLLFAFNLSVHISLAAGTVHRPELSFLIAGPCTVHHALCVRRAVLCAAPCAAPCSCRAAHTHTPPVAPGTGPEDRRLSLRALCNGDRGHATPRCCPSAPAPRRPRPAPTPHPHAPDLGPRPPSGALSMDNPHANAHKP